MDSAWRTIIWRQFGAAIDMLENALRACPDDLWSDRSQRLEFWFGSWSGGDFLGDAHRERCQVGADGFDGGDQALPQGSGGRRDALQRFQAGIELGAGRIEARAQVAGEVLDRLDLRGLGGGD